jgi:hypothetical protein
VEELKTNTTQQSPETAAGMTNARGALGHLDAEVGCHGVFQIAHGIIHL